MLSSVATSIIAFISTNIDNIFVLMLLYAQVDENFKKRDVVIGQYLGISLLIAVSLLGAFGLNFVPQRYIGLLGLIPMALGVKEWIEYKREKRSSASEDETDENAKLISDEADKKNSTLTKIKKAVSKVLRPEILNVTLVVLANGADNIGVYIPLFIGYTTAQIIVAIIIFALMLALWCYLGDKIVNLHGIKAFIQKHKHIIVPVLFIGLGIYIMVKSGLFGVL